LEKSVVGLLVSQETKNFLSLLNKCWVRKENYGIVLHPFVAQGDPNNGSFSEQKARVSWNTSAQALDTRVWALNP